MSDLKKMYAALLGDAFPQEMTITLGKTALVYRKRSWAITNA